LLIANPRQQWLRLFGERKALYEKLGKIRISTDNQKPKEVVENIVMALS
jgi:shikimate kinase